MQFLVGVLLKYKKQFIILCSEMTIRQFGEGGESKKGKKKRKNKQGKAQIHQISIQRTFAKAQRRKSVVLSWWQGFLGVRVGKGMLKRKCWGVGVVPGQRERSKAWEWRVKKVNNVKGKKTASFPLSIFILHFHYPCFVQLYFVLIIFFFSSCTFPLQLLSSLSMSFPFLKKVLFPYFPFFLFFNRPKSWDQSYIRLKMITTQCS